MKLLESAPAPTYACLSPTCSALSFPIDLKVCAALARDLPGLRSPVASKSRRSALTSLI